MSSVESSGIMDSTPRNTGIKASQRQRKSHILSKLSGPLLCIAIISISVSLHLIKMDQRKQHKRLLKESEILASESISEEQKQLYRQHGCVVTDRFLAYRKGRNKKDHCKQSIMQAMKELCGSDKYLAPSETQARCLLHGRSPEDRQDWKDAGELLREKEQQKSKPRNQGQSSEVEEMPSLWSVALLEKEWKQHINDNHNQHMNEDFPDFYWAHAYTEDFTEGWLGIIIIDNPNQCEYVTQTGNIAVNLEFRAGDRGVLRKQYRKPGVDAWVYPLKAQFKCGVRLLQKFEFAQIIV